MIILKLFENYVKVRCDGEVSHGRKRRASDIESLGPDYIELQKEIIVTGPSGNRISKSLGKQLIENEHKGKCN